MPSLSETYDRLKAETESEVSVQDGSDIESNYQDIKNITEYAESPLGS